MLRDESARLVGAARGNVIPLPLAAPLRDIEKAWIHTFRGRPLGYEAQWFDPASVEYRVLIGLEQLLAAGLIGHAHLGVIITNGERGARPNMNCAIATELWTDAMKALEAVVDLRAEQPQ